MKPLSSSGSRPFLKALVALLATISLGELYALYSQYQNNVYQRQYFSDNTSQVYTGIAALLALGLVAAYATHRLTGSAATSRTGRISRRLTGLAPVLLGLFSLIGWFTILAQILGNSLENFELYIVAVLSVLSVALILRDRITFRMSLRNFTRRKTSMAIVIAGLMIGTAMISGSLVTGDTLTNLFTGAAYFGYGHADEVVYARNATTGGYRFYSITTYQSFANQLSNDPTARPYLLGSTPEILDSVSVTDTTSGGIQSGVTLIGTYANASQTLGDFHAKEGTVIPSTFTDQQAVINDKAARDLNATTGDTITIYSVTSQSFKIVGVAASDARGDFSLGDNIFITLNAAQQLSSKPSSFNYLAITNIGGLRDSIQYSQTVGLAANRTLNTLLQPPTGYSCKTDPSQSGGPAADLCSYSEKQVSVNNDIQSAKSLTNLFLVLSTFAIIAGVVLILNIFIMLAEERRPEMGMARAVGMKRRQLTKLFLFEGSLYSAGAAAVGVFAGIAIAYAILYVFGEIISRVFPVNLTTVLNSFTFTSTSLLTAFTEGFLITYFTILLTSWRVAKLNIIRAIRSIPEPPQGLRTYTILLGLGIAMIAAGAVTFAGAAAAKSAVETLVGPSLMIFGIGLILSRFVLNRYAFTLTGLALLVQWAVPSFSWDNPGIQSYTFGPELYFAGGAIMVLGAIMFVMYNTDLVLRVFRFLLRGRKTLRVVFRVALAYPESRRFRTAATVAMFALVMFTVSAIALIAAEQNAALNTSIKQFSGGYDIITTTSTPVPNLATMFSGDPALQGKVSATIPFNSTILLSAHDETNGQDFNFPFLVGADPNATGPANFFTGNTFNMTDLAPGLTTASQVWSRVTGNSSDVVWSFGFVQTRGPPQPIPTPSAGDVLTLTALGPGGVPLPQKTVRVVGIMNGAFLTGIVATSRMLRDDFGVSTGSFAFVKVAAGQDPVTVSNLLKKDFVQLKLQTVVIPEVLDSFLRIGQSFLGLFEGFLALGLVVGVAGVGIISIRAVAERRQEIGILRALGFRRRMILAIFLLENSYVALLGIIIGVSLGINLGYAAAVTPGSGLRFVLPWDSLLEIIGFSYSLALLATVSSARRAARIPPAEALRYSE